jgi:sn-glycerol 3-phosphate transport system ATP-binding protein
MGRALVRRPQAFLLDEPLSNLDAKLRTQVRGDLKRLHREVPITSIYVTHDQVEAMTLGDRICVMSNGEVQQVGTTDDIYNRPANTFVAGFMGSPPMNLLPAVLQGGDLRVAGSALARVASPDRPVTLGVRPEDLHVAGPETTAAIAARVDLCEPLGSHVLLHVLVDADPGSPDGVPPTPVIVQVPPGTVFDSGTRIGLTVSPGKIHLFHAETGAADLTPRRVASA